MLSIAATKIVLLTAKRAGEVIGMRWQDIDLERAVWVVYDPAMTKTGQPHRCPLPREAVEILMALKPITGNRELVFYKPNTKLNRIALDVPRKTLQSAWGGRDVSARGTRQGRRRWKGGSARGGVRAAEITASEASGGHTASRRRQWILRTSIKSI